MPRGIITRFWLLLCYVAVSRQLRITEFEVPTAVPAGEDVELKCRYDLENKELDYVKWWLISLHGDNRAPLYQRFADKPGSPIRQNIALKKDEQDTIVLLNATAEDSGKYECEVVSNQDRDESREHQVLIVYTPGTGPELNLTAVADGPDDDDEEDDVLIECNADDVAPIPDFRITVNGLEMNFTKLVSGPDENGLYEIYGNATASGDDFEGADVRCELIYENPNITHPQFFDGQIYTTGAGTTTEAVEDTTELDTTPNTLQDENDGYQLKASWMMLLAVIACTFSLV